MTKELALRCPTEDDPEGGDLKGCGHEFKGWADWEGWVDCPHCGLAFKAYQGLRDEDA